MELHPDATLVELRERSGVKVSLVCVHNTLRRLGFTRKKSLRANEQRRPDIVLQRQAWCERLAGVDLARLVFLDETGAKTNMARAFARTRKGRRAVDYAPQGHWNTTTLVAAITLESTLAPMVLDGPMDAEAFEAYVEQLLTPALPAEAIVVMDDLSPHKGSAIARLLSSLRRRYN